MQTFGALKYFFSPADDATFEQAKNRLVLRVLIISSVVIFLIESVVMFFLDAYLVSLPPMWNIVLDGIFLIAFLLPINYFLIVRPMLHQIDAHYQTNQELRTSNELVERFFSIGDILIAYLDADMNFLRVNQAYADTDERKAWEFVGKNHFDLFPNDENLQIFTSVVETGKPYFAIEKPFSYAGHPERGISYWDWSLLPVKETNGQVIGLILVLNNVTARKKAQLALAEGELRFRVVFDQTFQQSVMIDPGGRVLLANETALKFSGLRHEDVQEMALWDLPWWISVPPMTREETAQQIKDAFEQACQGLVFRGEQRIRSASGETAIMDITIKPILDPQGDISLIVYEARDITQRTYAEEALVRSESRMKRMYLAEIQAREITEILRNAALEMSGSLNTETVLETLLDYLYKAVTYTSAHIFVFDDEDHLYVRLERGTEDWEPDHVLLGRRYDHHTLRFARKVLVERQVINNPDTLLYPGDIFVPEISSVISWLAIPLMAGTQVIGACVIEHKCPSSFSDERVNRAVALSSQASTAIQNAWLFEQVRDGREQLQALSRRLVEVQENERHYIARELHDEAGQALASLMIGLRHLERESGDPHIVVARAKELKKIADEVLENLHRLAIDLRPAALDHLGLIAALRQYAERISDEHELTVQFEVVGKIERLSGDAETTVYRIVQEGLTNIIRHARATRVDILVERRNEYLVVILEDNGVGFDPQVQTAGRLGMLGMHERTNMLGGKITFESAPGLGTTMILEVPCPFES